MDLPPTDPAPDAQARPAASPAVRRFVLVAAILASAMGFIDGSVVSLALPAMRADLGASLVEAQWISNAYMLFLSALVLLGGAAGDVFGVRNIFATGIVVFVATSAACALAPDASTLITMRGAQGVGAALMVPGSLALIAKTFPAAERGRAIGIWAAASSLTTAAGPFLGGMVLALGDPWMWRLIFAINVPVGLVALLLVLLRVPADRPSTGRRLDWPGAGLATVSLGLLAWGLTSLGLDQGARSLPSSVTLGGGAVLFVLFIAWEAVAPAPMVKLGLFRSPPFAGANLYTLVLFFGFNAVLFFLPMTLVTAWGVNEWQASLVLLPLSLFIGALSGLAGRVADRIGPRLPLTLGALAMATSYGLLAATMPLMLLWAVTLPVLMLMGLGMAMLVSPLSTAVMLATPDDDTGLASGVNNALARAAGLMAVAALGALAGIVFNRLLGPGVPIEFGEMAHLADPAAEALRVAATNRAFQAVAEVASAMCLLAAAIAWTTQPSWSARPAAAADGSAD